MIFFLGGGALDLTDGDSESTENETPESTENEEEILPIETPEIEPEETEIFSVASQLLTDITVGANKVDIADGNILLDQTGLSVNGVNVGGYDSTLPLELTGTANDTEGTYILIRGVETKIIFNNLSISTKAGETSKPVDFSTDAKVDLEIIGTNNIMNNGALQAAIAVETGAELTISGSGFLSAIVSGTNPDASDTAGCGIGGSINPSGDTSGMITINGGNINAEGGCGIGARNIRPIIINDGNVVATAAAKYVAGPGIGCSGNCDASDITINGGRVTATGNDRAPGIGFEGNITGNPTISVNNAQVNVQGGSESSGIGGGKTSASGEMTINISNGSVVEATAGDKTAADIGLGGTHSTASGDIQITTDSTVKTKGTGVGIGMQTIKGINTPSQVTVFITDSKIENVLNEYSIWTNILYLRTTEIDIKGGVNNSGIFVDNKDLNNIETHIFNTTILGGPVFSIKIADTGLVMSSNVFNQVVEIAVSGGRLLHFVDTNSIITSTDGGTSIPISNSCGDVTLRGTTLKAFNTASDFGVRATRSLSLENAEVEITTAGSGGLAVGFHAAGEKGIFKSINSNIKFHLGGQSLTDSQFAIYGNNVEITGGNIVSNGILYSEESLLLEQVYLNLEFTGTSVHARAGDLIMQGGYLKTPGTIEVAGKFQLGAELAGENEGSIVYAREVIGQSSEELNNGILFLENELISTNNTTEHFVGRVYGNVNFNKTKNGIAVPLVVEPNYTLYISDQVAESLSIPAGFDFINNGTIINEINVEVEGNYINSATGKLYNENLSSVVATKGGQISGKGSFINNGLVQNEIIVSELAIDGNYFFKNGVAQNVGNTLLKTMINKIAIEGVLDENTVYADHGIASLYVNDLLVDDSLVSEWSFMNLDRILRTVIYDYNDGTGKSDSILASALPLVKPTNPTKIGFDFDGWYLGEVVEGNVNLLSPWDFTTVIDPTVQAMPITLFAKWTKEAPVPTPVPTAVPTPTPTVAPTSTPTPPGSSAIAPVVTPTITPDVEEKTNAQNPTAVPVLDSSDATDNEAIDSDSTPGANVKGSIALSTLVFTGISLLLSVILIFIKKEDEKVEGDKIVKYKRNRIMMWTSVALSIVSIGIVLLTQSFNGSTTWFDIYSIITLVIMLISASLLYGGSLWKEVS